MLKNFICADGVEYPVEKCLSECGCRWVRRCATMSFLREAGHERKWNGLPSVTQLINGTRKAYLSIVTDYSAKPGDSAFRIIGSRGHAKLEKTGGSFEITEETLTLNGITGTFDSLEVEGNEITLTDTKTSGAYAVAKALGIKRESKDVPIIGDDGKPVLLKSGKNKGQAKTKKEYEIVRVDPDYREWQLQLNYYALMVKAAGFAPTKLVVFSIPRDGGTWKAESYGVTEKTYMIPVPFLGENEVLSYFEMKKAALVAAMETKTMPPMCTPDECWEGRKCTGFCAGAEACRAHGDNPYFSAPVQDGEAQGGNSEADN